MQNNKRINTETKKGQKDLIRTFRSTSLRVNTGDIFSHFA